MVSSAPASDAHSMFPDAFIPLAFIPLGQVPATAARLQRTAHELRARAGSPSAVPSLPVTLAHLEDAFDELAATMRLLAEAAAEWCDGDDADGGTLPPAARALSWHLRAAADALSESSKSCLASREWTRRLLDDAIPEPSSGVIMDMQTARRSSDGPSGRRAAAGRIVCGVDGSEQARRAASAALRLARRLGVQLTLVHVTPTRTVVPVDSFPMGVDPSTYPHSKELAFSEAEAAFNSLSSDVAVATVEREVRLGQPAAVLAQVAADCDAELIVVGSRGRGAWRSAVLGSVSSDVARLAPCPVMIVPERAAESQRARPERRYVAL
jgi:nucleotide-binding universal stress UspA family protein